MRTTAPFGLALAGLLALVGCTATPAATPTPAPTPSFTCTPEAGGAGYACDQRSYDDMKAKDALYAEAEQVYRKLNVERLRLYQTGAPADDAILSLVSGKAQDLIRQSHSYGDRLLEGTIDVVWVRRLPDLSMAGSVVAVEACLDSHTARVSSTGGGFNATGYSIERAYFGGQPGQLRVATFQIKEVPSCAR